MDPASPVSFIANVSINYTANTCIGDDAITATLQSSGAEAQGTVRIAPAIGKSIAFDDVKTSAKVVAIRGTSSASGLAESANIFFTVTDSTSAPIQGTRVNFSLLQSSSDAALACDGYPSVIIRVLKMNLQDAQLVILRERRGNHLHLCFGGISRSPI